MYNHVTVFDEIGKSAANNTHLSFEKKVHKDKILEKKKHCTIKHQVRNKQLL